MFLTLLIKKYLFLQSKKMVYTVRIGTFWLLALTFVWGVSCSDYVVDPGLKTFTEEELTKLAPYMAKQVCIHYLITNE